MKGAEFIDNINTAVLIISICPQIIGIIMWFKLMKTEKVKLSFLYGSFLLIPPAIVKQIK